MLDLHIRTAVAADIPLILDLIRQLAAYEREPDAARATAADLLRDGFTEPRRFECLIAEWQGAPAGFALFFHSYSTWEGRAGIYLEDLFVRPEIRGHGVGRGLLAQVAALAVERGCARLEWSVLDWNTPAIGFYHRLGARMKSEWTGMRVAGEALAALADESRC